MQSVKAQGVVVTCREGAGATAERVAASRRLNDWLARARDGGITVKAVDVYAVHEWASKAGAPKEVQFIHLVAEAYGPDGRRLNGESFLRGDTSDMLALLETPTETYVVFVLQARVAGAHSRVLSNPAGMIEAGEVAGVAGTRELNEEIGRDEEGAIIEWGEPLDMGKAVAGGNGLELVTPGGSDERSAFNMTKAKVSSDVAKRLEGRFAGADADEHTQVVVRPLRRAIAALGEFGPVDLKTLHSLLLYNAIVNGVVLI